MKALLLVLGFATLLVAHRNDEYLQATLLTIERGQIGIEVNLTPGQAVWPIILAMIDTDGDGRLSEGEKDAYTHKVLQSLSLEVDHTKLELRLLDSQFPAIDAMAAGLEPIRLRVYADLPASWAANHELRFVNHHAPAIGVYLVNCLRSKADEPRIAAQKRDYVQSEIKVDYSFQTRWPPIQRSVWWIGAVGIAVFGGWALWLRQRAVTLH